MGGGKGRQKTALPAARAKNTPSRSSCGPPSCHPAPGIPNREVCVGSKGLGPAAAFRPFVLASLRRRRRCFPSWAVRPVPLVAGAARRLRALCIDEHAQTGRPDSSPVLSPWPDRPSSYLRYIRARQEHPLQPSGSLRNVGRPVRPAYVSPSVALCTARLGGGTRRVSYA